MERVASALQNQAESPVPNPPCREGEDNRQSDLCAQWKAADAADSASRAAWVFGILGMLIGAATLIAAIKAAQYARKAAIHTETGANEAKRTADAAIEAVELTRAQSHPHISVEELTCTIEKDVLKVTVTLKNAGQTSAERFYVYTSAQYTVETGEIERFERAMFKHGTLAPGSPTSVTAPLVLELERVHALKAGEAVVRVELNVPFFDVFGGQWNFYLRLLIDADAVATKVPYTEECRQTRRDRAPGSNYQSPHIREQESKLL